MKGLEPPCLAAPDPKSGMSTNFITSAANKEPAFLSGRSANSAAFGAKKDGKGIIFCGLKKSFITALSRLSTLILRKIELSSLNWSVNLSDTNG